MIKIKFHKSWKDHLSEKQMEKIRAAFRFSLDYHDLHDKDHDVEVYFVDEVDENDKHIVGRYQIFSMKKSKVYLKMNRFIFSICSTIFHEVTHLKQYLQNDICFTQFGRTWRGKPLYDIDESNIKEYWESPQEIDARFHQRKMFWKWFLSIFFKSKK